MTGKPIRSRRIAAGLLAASTLASASAAVAQAPAAPTREELTQPETRATRPANRGSRLLVEGEIERAPCPLAEPAYAGVTVNFSSVSFRNLPADLPIDLSKSWAGYAGRDLPIATLCEIRDRAATQLRLLGYVAAVQVPPQRIEKGGEVQFDVLLARLVTVRLRGDTGHSAKLLERYLSRLTEQPIFNSISTERDLMLTRSLPGYTVRLILRPAGTKPGEVIGDVEVQRQPLDLQMAIHNMGSSAVGRTGVFASLRLNDLTGLGDSTRISLFNTVQTREQTVLQGEHDFAIGSQGLRFHGSLLHAWSKPDVSGAPFSARTLVGSLDASYPLILRSGLAMRGEAGLDLVDQKVFFGSLPFSRDKLRVAYLRTDLEASERQRGVRTFSGPPRWAATASLELRKGLAGLGASPNCTTSPGSCAGLAAPTSRLDGDPEALVLRASGRVDLNAARGILISATPRAQVANKPLLAFEQFSAGNYTTGRGFDPGALQGDDGVGVGLELAFGNPVARSPRDLRLAPYLFYDTAWTWTKGATVSFGSNHLHSAGVGMRGQWGQRTRFDLTLAQPLDRTGLQTRTGDTRILFTISTRLLPW